MIKLPGRKEIQGTGGQVLIEDIFPITVISLKEDQAEKGDLLKTGETGRIGGTTKAVEGR